MVNGHCSTCDIEGRCGYQYKPTDCANYRKFVQKPIEHIEVSVVVDRPRNRFDKIRFNEWKRGQCKN